MPRERALLPSLSLLLPIPECPDCLCPYCCWSKAFFLRDNLCAVRMMYGNWQDMAITIMRYYFVMETAGEKCRWTIISQSGICPSLLDNIWSQRCKGDLGSCLVKQPCSASITAVPPGSVALAEEAGERMGQSPCIHASEKCCWKAFPCLHDHFKKAELQMIMCRG